MKVSRTVTYAIQSLLMLMQQQSDSPVPCSRLSNDGGMPERFLLQILRQLVNAGVLHSVRGVDGGYRLARTAEEITLLDVVEAVEGPLGAPTENQEGLPPEASTKLRDIYQQIGVSLRREFGQVTMRHLANQPFDPGLGDALSAG